MHPVHICSNLHGRHWVNVKRNATQTAQQSNDPLGNFVQYRAAGNTKVKNFVVRLP
jgi:hypothetical protein